MYIIVVGCGRVGSELAYGLYKKGHEVAIIDHVGGSFSHLPADYRGRTIEGEVLSEDVLRRTGVEQADGLAAVTNSDAVNAVVGHVARAVYNVRHVVVRNYDPRWRELHEAFGLQVVSSTAWGAGRIEELLSHPFGRSVLSTGNGEVEIFEIPVPDSWGGRPLEDLLPSGGECLPVSITRAGKAMLPKPGLRFEAGDVVHVSATLVGVEELRGRAAGGR
ncbi:MAG: potassium channel family protein [Vicinamibacteria bacterium]